MSRPARKVEEDDDDDGKRVRPMTIVRDKKKKRPREEEEEKKKVAADEPEKKRPRFEKEEKETMDETYKKTLVQSLGDNLFLIPRHVAGILHYWIQQNTPLTLPNLSGAQLTRFDELRHDTTAFLSRFVLPPLDLVILLQANALPTLQDKVPRPFGIWHWFGANYAITDKVIKDRLETRAVGANERCSYLLDMMGTMTANPHAFWNNVTLYQMRAHYGVTGFKYSRELGRHYWPAFFIITACWIKIEELVAQFIHQCPASCLDEFLLTTGRNMVRALGDGVSAVHWPPNANPQDRTTVQGLAARMQQCEDPRKTLEQVRKARRAIAKLAEATYNAMSDAPSVLQTEDWILSVKETHDKAVVMDYDMQHIVLRDQVLYRVGQSLSTE
jgi:hypothetical protein